MSCAIERLQADRARTATASVRYSGSVLVNPAYGGGGREDPVAFAHGGDGQARRLADCEGEDVLGIATVDAPVAVNVAGESLQRIEVAATAEGFQDVGGVERAHCAPEPGTFAHLDGP
jgi:hypothetical protein